MNEQQKIALDVLVAALSNAHCCGVLNELPLSPAMINKFCEVVLLTHLQNAES